MGIKIVTDSGSDISPELAQQLGITVIPLYVHFGEEVYRDGVDMVAEEFYERLIRDPIHPTTSAPSPGDFAELYRKLAQETDTIVSVHVSTKLSATYDAALQGREALADEKCRIEVIDTESVTVGTAVIAAAVAEVVQSGESLEQVLGKLQQIIRGGHVMALLSTLKYLAKGGRIGKAASLLGTTLNVKPMVVVRDGEVHPAGLARTQDKGIERLCRFVKSAPHVQHLVVGYTTPSEGLQKLVKRMGTIVPEASVNVCRVGPVLGTHIGPEALIVAFTEEETQE